MQSPQGNVRHYASTLQPLTPLLSLARVRNCPHSSAIVTITPPPPRVTLQRELKNIVMTATQNPELETLVAEEPSPKKPRCVATPGRTPTQFGGPRTDRFRRRYATHRIRRISSLRGLKSTATLFASLRDGRCLAVDAKSGLDQVAFLWIRTS